MFGGRTTEIRGILESMWVLRGSDHCDVWRKNYRNRGDLGEHMGAVHEGRFDHCDVCKKDI